MLKTSNWLFLLLILGFTLSATAQKTDSLKADTNLLNKYRIEPGRNALPLRYRPATIEEEQLPVTFLNYKVSYWHKSVLFGLNFNQSAFTSNYSAGGVSAIALGSNFDYKAEYNKTPLDFTTELNLLYGISKNKGQGSRKTNDRIFFDNKLAKQLSKRWFFFGSLTFESQFTKGFNYTNPDGTDAQTPYEISDFMAPGYLTESIGFEYKPTKYFDLRFGTGTARQTFVLDTTIYHNQPTNYGVPIGHTVYNELAVSVVAAIDKDLMKNLHINVRYALFIPYIQPFAYMSHRIDATLTAKVNRLIAVTMNGTFLYDKHTSDAVQGTEGLALGVIYKFP
ncbi:Protein of unknown function (DUF3078) [Mucilaginibacter frigoritolerans]|uniref:DUF3078 family protein n=1 Tax=Mucilaginibacter frigoritolerans TaxID=652788 RepID=A0A562U2E2_9SPHI|nr:DUF3078 domain-containing protein [Mucilaginibacter frigoritolerans]TWI99476.1 Protein of unknown function (DUF3078) [Mucilaginibacter frigoritolerans]